jgi:hypothetical protein
MDKALRREAIIALIRVLRADGEAIAKSAAEAELLFDDGNQTGAIGELLIIESQVERVRNYRTILSLHRDA